MGKINSANTGARAAGLALAASLLLAPASLAFDRAVAAERGATDRSANEATEAESNALEARLRGYLAEPFEYALDQTAIEALAMWGEWAAERGYVGYLSADQSTLFFSLARRSGNGELDTIESVERQLYDLMPTPRTRHRGPITGTGGPTTKVYPLGGEAPLWKHDLDPIDLFTGVLFEFDNDRDYEAFVERATANLPEHEQARHLGERSRSFLSRDAAAYVWRVGSCPDGNQVAHAAAQFALEQRFRFLPAWMRDGVAWTLEREATGTVRCLPDSRGASSRDFAQDWEVDARVRPFDGTWVERVDQLNDFGPSDRYVLDAGLAFELVSDLLTADAQNVSNAAEELRLYWEDHAVRHHPRDGFQRVWTYRTPSHVQARILAPLLGPVRGGVEAE